MCGGGRAGQRGPRCDNRLFVDALLWMARSGARWRDLPGRYGDHQAVKRRYYRWVARDALGGFLAVLAADSDLEWLMIDSTVVRAHQHSAGAQKKLVRTTPARAPARTRRSGAPAAA